MGAALLSPSFSHGSHDIGKRVREAGLRKGISLPEDRPESMDWKASVDGGEWGRESGEQVEWVVEEAEADFDLDLESMADLTSEGFLENVVWGKLIDCALSAGADVDGGGASDVDMDDGEEVKEDEGEWDGEEELEMKDIVGEEGTSRPRTRGTCGSMSAPATPPCVRERQGLIISEAEVQAAVSPRRFSARQTGEVLPSFEGRFSRGVRWTNCSPDTRPHARIPHPPHTQLPPPRPPSFLRPPPQHTAIRVFTGKGGVYVDEQTGGEGGQSRRGKATRAWGVDILSVKVPVPCADREEVAAVPKDMVMKEKGLSLPLGFLDAPASRPYPQSAGQCLQGGTGAMGTSYTVGRGHWPSSARDRACARLSSGQVFERGDGSSRDSTGDALTRDAFSGISGCMAGEVEGHSLAGRRVWDGVGAREGVTTPRLTVKERERIKERESGCLVAPKSLRPKAHPPASALPSNRHRCLSLYLPPATSLPLPPVSAPPFLGPAALVARPLQNAIF